MNTHVLQQTNRQLNSGPTGTGVLQRKCACGQHTVAGSECAECRKKRLLQRKPESGIQSAIAPPIVHEVLRSPGQPLDNDSRAFMESRFGHDLSMVPTLSAQSARLQTSGFMINQPGDAYEREANQIADRVVAGKSDSDLAEAPHSQPSLFGPVRVHYDAVAVESARTIGAEAYTVGSHIVFGAGHYSPQSVTGRRLLAHELTHVVQQNGISKPKMIMRQACGHDGQATQCSGGALARWRLVNIATNEVTDLALDDIIVNSGTSRHFGGTWVTQVQTPPNPVKSGIERGRVDGLKVRVGDPLQVEVVEIKPRSTEFNGGCALASREANGYVQELRGIAPRVVAVSRATQAQGGLRTEGNRLNAEQRRQLTVGGVDVRNPIDMLAWRFYNSLQNRLNTTFVTGFSNLNVEVNRDGTPGQDYEAGVPILVDCRTRRGRQGVRVRQLLFQVNGAGGISYGCRNTECQDEEEERQRQPVSVPQQQEARERQRETQPRGEQPTEQPGTDLTVPILVAGGGAALGAGAVAAARRRAAQIAAQRLAAEAARREAQRLAAQAAWRRAAEAAARRRAMQAAGQGAGRRVAGRVAGRALIYGEVAAAAILLLSGRAEARPGPGQSALETLYQSMTQNGTPPSPEMRELIESDPLLRQLAEEAATRGNTGPLQEEMTRRMLEIIRNNPDQFSPEDLEVLMQVSDATSGFGTAPQTAEQLRAAIERARAFQRGEATPGQSEGTGAGATGTTQTPSGQSESAQGEGSQGSGTAEREVGERYPRLSAESRQQLAQAPNDVRRLFTAMTSGSGRGPQVTDEAVRRFLQTVPADLTTDEVQQLIQQLRPAETDSLDEVMRRLQSAVQHIRGGQQQDQAQGDATDVQGEQQRQPEQGGAEQEGVTVEEYARGVVAQINGYGGWNSIEVGSARIIITDEGRGFNNARLNRDVLNVAILQKTPVPGGFIRVGAFAQAVITARTRTTATIEFRSAVVLINETGQRIDTIAAGRRFTATDIR